MKLLPLIFLIGGIALFSAQKSATSTQNLPKVSDAIHQLFIEDGEEVPGAANGISKLSEEEYSVRLKVRQAKVKALLATDQLKTGEDFNEAALIFQHGNNPDDCLFAHVLAMEAVLKGSKGAKWAEAATLDRYLQSIGRPQVFGTQYPLDPNLPHRMASPGPFLTGRTLAPYNEQFLPDSARLDFCVPVLATQKQNVAMFNAGQRPRATMMAPGCKRY